MSASDSDSTDAYRSYPQCPSCGKAVITVAVAGPGHIHVGPCSCRVPTIPKRKPQAGQVSTI